MLEQILANSDLVTPISIGAGFCSGLFQSGVDFILRIKIDKQTIPASKVAIALLFSSLLGAVTFYIAIPVVFRILDPSVSATELNELGIYLAAVFIILPFIERLSLDILTRFGIFNRDK